MSGKFVADNKYPHLDEPTKNFLGSLASHRKSAGLTQKVLAGILNIAEATLSDYERGKRIPTVRLLIRLAELLGFDLSESINYKLYHNLINPKSLRRIFVKYGFNYTELAELTGYCQRSIRDCFHFSDRATTQCFAVIISILESERTARES